jgi:hypothetical protein
VGAVVAGEHVVADAEPTPQRAPSVIVASVPSSDATSIARKQRLDVRARPDTAEIGHDAPSGSAPAVGPAEPSPTATQPKSPTSEVTPAPTPTSEEPALPLPSVPTLETPTPPELPELPPLELPPAPLNVPELPDAPLELPTLP